MKLSVVISTLNREEVLCETIRYFLEGETFPDREIIVIDQSDRHGVETDLYLTQIAHRIQYIRTAKKSLPAARNEGVRRATGEVVVFVDDDVVPRPGFLEAHARPYADPRVIGVTGPALSPGESLKSREDIGEASFRDLIATRASRFDVGIASDAQWAVGCNMSFRREAIVRLGGFDEVFERSPIGDDAEFSHRAKGLGVIRYEPAAALVHLQAPSGGTRDAATEQEYVRQVAFCTNYFWHRVNATRRQRLTMLWRLYRNRVANRDAFNHRRRLTRLSLGFVRGWYQSARIVRRRHSRDAIVKR